MREFRRIMTGPKQGVYSVRRAQSARRNAATQPLLTIGQIPRAVAADFIGSVD